MKLTRAQQHILKRLCEGLAYKELAYETKSTVAGINSRLYRARKVNNLRTTYQLIHFFTLENQCQPLPTHSPAGPTTERSMSRSPASTATPSQSPTH